jgi:hypothetical protein
MNFLGEDDLVLQKPTSEALCQKANRNLCSRLGNDRPIGSGQRFFPVEVLPLRWDQSHERRQNIILTEFSIGLALVRREFHLAGSRRGLVCGAPGSGKAPAM